MRYKIIIKKKKYVYSDLTSNLVQKISPTNWVVNQNLVMLLIAQFAVDSQHFFRFNRINKAKIHWNW